MKLTFGVNFVCRESKTNKKGLAPIEMSISVNGERVFMSLPYRCEPKLFRRDMASRKSNEVKSFCQSYSNDVQSAVVVLRQNGVKVSACNIKDYLINGCSTSYKVSDLRDDFLVIQRKRTLSDLGMDAYRRYELSISMFIDVVGDKEVADVSNNDVLMYEAEVKAKYKGSSAYGYLSRVKSFFIYAVNNKRITVNPFNSIKLRKCEAEVRCMSVADYERMRDRDFGCERLNSVRDLFVLAGNCGLAYVDLVSLKKDDFQFDNGRVVISKKRQKTDVRFFSYVLPDGIKILEKYGYDISSIKLSNQKGNAYAKEIMNICNIESVDSLTFHKMRHYYITNLIRMGVDVSVVRLCAGHKRLQQTMSYTHIGINDIADAVDRCL